MEHKKNKLKPFMTVVLFLAIFFFSTERPAEAYLDPAAGNAIVYALVALAGAVLYAVKGAYYWIIKRIGGSSAISLSEQGAVQGAKRLVIFSEGKTYWNTFRLVVEELRERRIPFSYYTMDIHDPGLTIEDECMNARYIGKGARGFAKIGRLQADILLSTSPNIGTPGYPLPRSPRIGSLVHTFHALTELAWYRKGSLDHYDVVLMVGPQMESSIRFLENLRGTKQKVLIPAGVPYLDLLAKEMKSPLPPTDGKTILVAPSWGTKGCLSLYGSGFVRKLAQVGYAVILRPHPQSLLVERDLIDKVRLELADFENVVWDLSTNLTRAMEQADLLISDVSIIRLDFAFLYQRPVITLEMPVPDPQEWECQDLGGAIWLETVEKEIGEKIGKGEVENIVDHVRRTLAETKARDFRELRDKYVSNFGRSGKVIADYLVSALDETELKKECA